MPVPPAACAAGRDAPPASRGARTCSARGAGRALPASALIAVALLLSGCGTALDGPDPGRSPTATAGTVTTTPTTTTPTTATTTAPTIVPVTPDGLVTGPGVTDRSIALGLLVDPVRDRGFSAGVRLWQQAVNTSGGLCGRTIRLATNGEATVPVDPVTAYDAIGRTVLGLITLPSTAETTPLADKVAVDQLVALAPVGSSAQLGSARPIVVGPTQDIIAINGLDHLLQADKLRQGDTVGVLSDGSAESENALNGARWWATQRGVQLDVRNTADARAPADWGTATTVFALTDSATTAKLAMALPPTVGILTTIDGYDPTKWDEGADAVATAGRVLVTAATPAYGSDYPAAVAVASRATSVGGVTPAPRLLDGYATGVSWSRLLTQACTDRTLTRAAIQQAATTVGPASVDSLFGPSDPALPAVSGLPATRVSAVSTADPSALAGLAPLTWLEAASGIEDYQP